MVKRSPHRTSGLKFGIILSVRGGTRGRSVFDIGDGDSRAQLEARAKGLALSFAGAVPHGEVRARMAAAKALVLPSVWWEGLPMTALESLASATPCVVSDLGPLPELVKDGAFG